MRAALPHLASTLAPSVVRASKAFEVPPYGPAVDAGTRGGRPSPNTMTEDEIASVVVDCLYEISRVHRSLIVGSRHFSEYGVDLALEVDFVVLLEERLKIDIPNDVVGRLKCVDDFVRHLAPRIANVCETAPRPSRRGG
jgi:hypothetical protein